jgi:hypothetical protein
MTLLIERLRSAVLTVLTGIHDSRLRRGGTGDILRGLTSIVAIPVQGAGIRKWIS